MPQTRTSRALTRGILATGAVYAASRALAYTIPGRDIQDPLTLASLDGRLIPAYAALWAAAAALCLWDIRRPTLHGLGTTAVIIMTTIWAAAYLLGWAVTLIQTGESPLWWQTSATYGAPALCGILGLHLHSTLTRRLTQEGAAPDA